MNFNLYKLLNYHRKNSILRSVNLTNKYEGAHFRIVEIEPYDQTGVNCLDSTPTRYDKAINTIEKALHRLELRMIKNNKGSHQKNIYRLCIYSNEYEPFEFIFDPVNMKEF